MLVQWIRRHTLFVSLWIVGALVLGLSGPLWTAAAAPTLQAQDVYSWATECEQFDAATPGTTITWRSQASALKTVGHFGANATWAATPAEVRYTMAALPRAGTLTAKIRFSRRQHLADVPIMLLIDGVQKVSSYYVVPKTGDWNRFIYSSELNLGRVEAGTHTLTIATGGQAWGVCDLDRIEVNGTLDPPTSPVVTFMEAESPIAATTGRALYRSQASPTSPKAGQVWGQVGCVEQPGYPAKAGYVDYRFSPSASGKLWLRLRYSRNNRAEAPAATVALDGKMLATMKPKDTGSWNIFADSDEMGLGSVVAGQHYTLRIETEGAQYGLMDLDRLELTVR